MTTDNLKLLTDIITRFLLTIGGTWLTNKGFSHEDATFITAGLGILVTSLLYSTYRNFALRNQPAPQKPETEKPQ